MQLAEFFRGISTFSAIFFIISYQQLNTASMLHYNWGEPE